MISKKRNKSKNNKNNNNNIINLSINQLLNNFSLLNKFPQLLSTKYLRSSNIKIQNNDNNLKNKSKNHIKLDENKNNNKSKNIKISKKKKLSINLNIKNKSKSLKNSISKNKSKKKSIKNDSSKNDIKNDNNNKSKTSKKEKKFTFVTSRTKILNIDCPLFLEGKCDKLFCDHIHNYTKIYKKINNENFYKNFSQLQSDFKILEPYQKKLFKNQELDIMFLVDCTGSMQTYINQVKNELNSIIDYILKNNPYVNIKISFVGFRDYKDSNRFEIFDFSNDIDALKTFISKIVAIGGGDLPEDLTGGLEKGLSMSWREKSAKYCLIITDAPCHGAKFFYPLAFDDDFRGGDPEGKNPLNFIEEFGKKDITLYALRIKYYTDPMYTLFNESYKKSNKLNSPIIISELGNNHEEFGFMVAVSSNTTLNNLTVNNLHLNDILIDIDKEQNSNNQENLNLTHLLTRLKNFQKNNDSTNSYEIIYNKDKVNKDRTYDQFLNENKNLIKAKCHSFEIKNDRYLNINYENPFISHNEVQTECFIDKIPFNEGSEHLAYYLFDKTVNLKYVGKLKKMYSKETYTIDNLKKELESITICSYISNIFNDRIVNYLPNNKTNILINFIHNYIYEADDKLYLVENYIEGKYEKYNNNAGWIKESIADVTLLAQAFSHFSYQISKGYLLIVDLQGVGGYLTDPQIHCLDGNKFGNGNLNYVGILKFFLTHKCNKYCKNLELIHPNENFSINIDKYEFYVDNYIEPNNKDEMIYKLCDLCRKPFLMKKGEIFELKKKCWDCFCGKCDEERKKNFKKSMCEKCKKFFVSSEYFFKMKRLPFPKQCMKCRQESINEERKKYYKEIFN